MGLINSKIHGLLDYGVGVLLVAAPWLLGFYKGGLESYVPIALGIITLVYSLLTNYELGVIKTFSFPTHLLLDVVSGIFLAASPWLFQFSNTVYLPHLVIGLLELGVVTLSNRVAYSRPHNNVLG